MGENVQRAAINGRSGLDSPRAAPAGMGCIWSALWFVAEVSEMDVSN